MSVVRALRSGVGVGRAAAVLALSFVQLPVQSGCGVDKEVPVERARDAATPDDPWAAPLTFSVDESLRPSADSVGRLDGRERRVEALASPDGETVELLVDELLVGTVDPTALAPLLERRGGEVLWQIEAGSAGTGFSLVRIEPRPAAPEDVVRLVREMGEQGVGLEGGAQRVSHPDVLGLLVALLEESASLDAPVSPNVVMSLATLGEGSTLEANDLGSTGLSRDACSWPHMKSGGAQDIGVCDAWRVLLQQGADANRVEVGVIDQGFAATLDTPEGSTFYVPGMVHEGGPFWEGPPSMTRCSDGGDCSWHGTWTSSALGAVPDDGWGSAGPGGLNARIQHLEPATALGSTVLDRLERGSLTLDQLQAGLVSAIADRLPARSVAYVGVANRIPWPLSVLVERGMDPVFAAARDAGILVVAPAGNAHDVDQLHVVGTAPNAGWETAMSFPCELTSVLCVGGLARDSTLRDEQSAFGSPHPEGMEVSHAQGSVDLYGPSSVVVGPDPNDELSASSSLLRERRGTSLAAAFTAGVAVQVWATHPSLTADDVEQILLDTMHTGSLSPEVVGWVHAAAAVERAACPRSTSMRYLDADGDGFGDPANAKDSCLELDGYVVDGGDCDDTDEDVFPGAEERCDGADQNCDPDDEQGLACDDGLFCTRDDVCDDGECQGRRSPCDGDERCVERDDACVLSGCREDADCDDERYCNGDETCDTERGECEEGSRMLSDGVACTVDSCANSDDHVEHAPDDASCADGLFCSGQEICDALDGCAPGSDPCPDQPCDEAHDECDPCTSGVDCDDGVYCNGAETCNTDAGTCVAGTPPTLSDSVNCTVDTCNESTDSIEHALSNVACDDGLYCNGAETCHRTLGCQAGAIALNDSVSCTVDSCDEETDSVEHVPTSALCSDNLYCNGAETCHPTLGCQAGAAPTLSDSIGCTTDSCDEGANQVVHAPNDAACSDGLYCDGSETCHPTLDCQEGNAPCSASICNEQQNFCDLCTGNDDCDDDRYCNGVETCNTQTGVCSSGVAPSDPDNVDCTLDSCDEVTDGFIHTPEDSDCDDGVYCNGAERCDELLGCRPRTPPSPADSVSCTNDSCDEATDSFVHAPVNGACSDALFCTGSESCHVTLGCQASGNPCSGSQCSETLDVCVACLVDGHCGDGQFCDGVEQCNVGAGTCGSGTPAVIDDGIDCTDDSCDEEADEVVHDPDDDACDDDLFCTGTETCDETLGCQASGDPCSSGHCSDALDACVACLDDDDCSDGDFCNGVEQCNVGAGTCGPGTPPTIDDGVDCTDDSCDEEADEVVHDPDDDACDDELYCNGVESCDPVEDCVDGTPPEVDDGVPCTQDSCDEDTDSIDNTPNDGDCDDGDYCNGAETCDADQGCENGSDPCPSQLCDEDTDSCTE